MATLLSIVQDAAMEAGIPSPSVVIGSEDLSVLKLRAMSNREGRALARDHTWTILQRVHTFSTVSSTDEYSLPSDYSRLIRNTEWDRTNAEPIFGPLTPQQWQNIKSGILGTSVADRRYRIYRSASSATKVFHLEPTPSSSGDTLAFEYISNQWCTDSGGTGQDRWAADDDVSIMDEDLMILGLICRYKRSTGLEFASEADEYQSTYSTLTGQDRPAPALRLGASAPMPLISTGNAPWVIDIS